MEKLSILKYIHFLVTDIVFPSFCCICGKIISNNDWGVCSLCRQMIDIDVRNYTGDYVFKIEEEIHGKRFWYIDDGVWIFKYENSIPGLIYSMKFKNHYSIAVLFAEYCITSLNILKWDFDIVTFIPAAKERLWERGFNHSKVMAKCIGKAFGKEVINLFSLKNKQIAQKKLSSIERFLNTYQKFDIIHNCSNIVGKSVLIVDDVYTTGATLNECSRLLKHAGAKHVYTCVTAYAMFKEMVC